MRAWVEILVRRRGPIQAAVALHVRAWVEIGVLSTKRKTKNVALHVRAWVEMLSGLDNLNGLISRPPCEGVGRNSNWRNNWVVREESPSM